MTRRSMDQAEINEAWRAFMTGDDPSFHSYRKRFLLLPSSPRCKVCCAPFGGLGGRAMRLVGRAPAKMNPNMCGACETYARERPGGAEIPLSLLFADIRGSTGLAETLGTARFSELIARFYDAVTDELIKADGLIDRLIGDEVVALFVPALAGKRHAEVAVRAAQGVLRATGHGRSEEPWVPVGVSVHTGMAFVGAVGKAGVSDVTALGDEVNLTARLASVAQAGEILITEATREAAGLSGEGMEARRLELKGRSTSVDAWIMRVDGRGL